MDCLFAAELSQLLHRHELVPLHFYFNPVGIHCHTLGNKYIQRAKRRDLPSGSAQPAALHWIRSGRYSRRMQYSMWEGWRKRWSRRAPNNYRASSIFLGTHRRTDYHFGYHGKDVQKCCKSCETNSEAWCQCPSTQNVVICSTDQHQQQFYWSTGAILKASFFA